MIDVAAAFGITTFVLMMGDVFGVAPEMTRESIGRVVLAWSQLTIAIVFLRLGR